MLAYAMLCQGKWAYLKLVCKCVCLPYQAPVSDDGHLLCSELTQGATAQQKYISAGVESFSTIHRPFGVLLMNTPMSHPRLIVNAQLHAFETMIKS